MCFLKIKDLKAVCYSSHGRVQMVIVWDCVSRKDVALGAIEYVIKEFGELEIIRLLADENRLILEVRL